MVTSRLVNSLYRFIRIGMLGLSLVIFCSAFANAAWKKQPVEVDSVSVVPFTANIEVGNPNNEISVFTLTTNTEDITFNELVFRGNKGFNSSVIAEVRLYQGRSTGSGDLITSLDGSSIQRNTLTFRNLALSLSKSTTHTFSVVVDINDTTSLVGEQVSLQVRNMRGKYGKKGKVKFVYEGNRLPFLLPPSRIVTVVDQLVEVDPIRVSGVSLTNVDVPQGTQNVDFLLFQVEANDQGPAFVQEYNVHGNGGFSSDVVTAVRLWKKLPLGWELMQEVGGFEIQNNELTFSSFDEVEISAGDDRLFLVTLDILDHPSVVGAFIQGSLEGVRADDSDNSLLEVTGLPVDSNRGIYVTPTGELFVHADNSDSETNRPRHVLAGGESSFVASFELTAVNEGIDVETFSLQAEGDTLNFATAVLEVVVYDEDQITELGRQTVVGSSVEFRNINMSLPIGSQNIYVTVVADLIGDNQNGLQTSDISFRLAVDASDYEGQDSEKQGVSDLLSTASRVFDIVPVRISSLEISEYDTNGIQIVDGELNSPTEKLAVVNIMTDSWETTDVLGRDAELAIHSLTVSVATNNLPGLTASDFRLRRLNTSIEPFIEASSYDGHYLTFDLLNGYTTDHLLDASSQGSFVIEFNNVGISFTEASINIEFDESDGSEIIYADSSYDAGAFACNIPFNCSPVSDLRLDSTYFGRVDVTDTN